MHAHHALSEHHDAHGSPDAHGDHGSPGADALRGGPRSTPHGGSLSRLALSATLHCLTGCSIGEVLGMAAGAAFDWSNGPTIAVSVVLAYLFGYALTLRPLLRGGLPWATALPLALASDTVSISVMEVVDNAVMMWIPGAMDAPLSSPLFWGSLLLSLALAGAAAYPVNLWLIARGRGHAAMRH